uniref:photosystem II protein Z n=1 Tax=Merotricha bacillata TaxID=658122 RepID=UPI002114B4C9|nr:photosystem II protein Z [Merotricha bacillata]UTE94588.1 photosystem II protein Z [Merotricha bacillata]
MNYIKIYSKINFKFFVAFGEEYMSLLIQILVSLLVLLSFILIVNIPIALGTPSEWETSKKNIFNLAKFWISLVFITGFAQAFA